MPLQVVPSNGKEQVTLSSFLRRTLPVLPLYARPPTWRLWLWQLCCGGLHGSAMAVIATTGSLLKAMLDSPDLDKRCMALMDVGLMLGTAIYQVTFTARRAQTRRMLEDLVVLAEELEADATADDLQDLRATVKGMRAVRNVTAFFVVTIPSLMLIAPVLTGELAMTFYPRPTGVLWYLVCVAQDVGTVTCPLCVNAIMFTLLLVSNGSASLARCISRRLQTCHGERAMVRMAHLHRQLLEIGDSVATTYYPTLFVLVSGLLATSLLATFNVATGSFDSYTAMLVPAPLLFYYNIASISENLATSTEDVGEGVWGSAWTEEDVKARRVLLNMMTRAQKACSVRVPILGDVTLPVFKDSMRQWYSFLQMIRSING
nr:odorant receptor [Odontothrips loti]